MRSALRAFDVFFFKIWVGVFTYFHFKIIDISFKMTDFGDTNLFWNTMTTTMMMMMMMKEI